MKLHFSNEWLKAQIESDPDLPVDIGSFNIPTRHTTSDSENTPLTHQEIWAKLVDRAAELRQAGLNHGTHKWEHAATELESMANWITIEMTNLSNNRRSQ